MIKKIAPAKINLFLHLLGKREDNYHLLDSIFVFTKTGDEITVFPDQTLSLTIDGPFASVLNTDPNNNLVLKAARLLQSHYQIKTGARIHLKKNIPIGAGLGGGSSDAAATLKALIQLWNIQIDEATLGNLSLSLGADVPACLVQQPVRVSGIGEKLALIPISLSSLPILLVKPLLSLSTPDIYQAFSKNNFSFSEPAIIDYSNERTFLESLKNTHNDLYLVAKKIAPEVENTVKKLDQQPGCLLARMSGSGSSCFAIFSAKKTCENAAEKMRSAFPAYWVVESTI